MPDYTVSAQKLLSAEGRAQAAGYVSMASACLLFAILAKLWSLSVCILTSVFGRGEQSSLPSGRTESFSCSCQYPPPRFHLFPTSAITKTQYISKCDYLERTPHPPPCVERRPGQATSSGRQTGRWSTSPSMATRSARASRITAPPGRESCSL